MIRILAVDDDEQILRLIRNALMREGYDVTALADPIEVKRLRLEEYQLILLDVMMPLKDGYEVCKGIRRKSSVPIILITARGEDYDKIMGLDIGADDYIVKPFSPSEVMARLRAVLRRFVATEVSENSDTILRINNMTVNLEEYSFAIGDKKVPLTKKEIETMWTLASNPNKVFTRDNLLDSLWGYDYYGDSRTVDSHIKRLRAKIDTVEHPAWSIKTIWGVGYKFEINDNDV